MILPVKVAKLYRHADDEEFNRVMRQVEASIEEGVLVFDLEVDRLDQNIKFELMDAFESLGWEIEYRPEEELLKIYGDQN